MQTDLELKLKKMPVGAMTHSIILQSAIARLEKIRAVAEEGKTKEYYHRILDIEEAIAFLENDLIMHGIIERSP